MSAPIAASDKNGKSANISITPVSGLDITVSITTTVTMKPMTAPAGK